MVKSRRRIGRSKISSGASSLKIRRKKSNRTKKLNKRARKPKRTKKRNLKKQKVYSGRERPLYHKLNRPERLLVHMEGGAEAAVPEVVKEVMWHGDYPGIRQLEKSEKVPKKNQIDDPPLPQPVVPDEQVRLARQGSHERLMEEADRVALGRAARAARAEADIGFDPGAPSPEPEQAGAEAGARVEQARAELARAQQARSDLRRVRAEQVRLARQGSHERLMEEAEQARSDLRRARAENQARVEQARALLEQTNMELELARVALGDAMTTRGAAVAAREEGRRRRLAAQEEQTRNYLEDLGNIVSGRRIHDV